MCSDLRANYRGRSALSSPRGDNSGSSGAPAGWRRSQPRGDARAGSPRADPRRNGRDRRQARVPGATIEHIVKRAGVSRATFYEHFENREDCVLAGFAERRWSCSGWMETAVAEADEWPGQVRAALAAFLEHTRSKPRPGSDLHRRVGDRRPGGDGTLRAGTRRPSSRSSGSVASSGKPTASCRTNSRT